MGRAHFSMTDMEKWLGAEFGRDGARPLRAEMYKNFLIGAAADVWTLDDVPDASKEGTLDGAASSLLRRSWPNATRPGDRHKV